MITYFKKTALHRDKMIIKKDYNDILLDTN